MCIRDSHIHGVAPAEMLTIADYGDVEIEMAYIEKSMGFITEEVGAVLSQGPMVVALGGWPAARHPGELWLHVRGAEKLPGSHLLPCLLYTSRCV